MNYSTSGMCFKYKIFQNWSLLNISFSYIEEKRKPFHNWNNIPYEIFHNWSIYNTDHSYIEKFMEYSTDDIYFKYKYSKTGVFLTFLALIQKYANHSTTGIS